MALPAPTALSTTTRYALFGNRKYTWVPTIATKTAPTLAELSAGTDLSGEVAAVSGFSVTRADIDVPDAVSEFTAKIPGRTTADSSSLTLYASKTSTDARTLLLQDTNGFIVIYPEGIVTGSTLDVFPVRIAAVSKPNDIEASGVLEAMFTVTSKPAQNITIPSA
jgi:hypothetical protein